MDFYVYVDFGFYLAVYVVGCFEFHLDLDFGFDFDVDVRVDFDFDVFSAFMHFELLL